MCMVLYISSDIELPISQYSEMCDIFIKDIDENVLCVKNKFTKKFVYYVGSYQGCGCGFSYWKSEDVELGCHEELIRLMKDDLEDQKRRRCSVETLFKFISEILNDGHEIELYSCWSGKENLSPELKWVIKLSDFILGEEFKFEENQLIICN